NLSLASDATLQARCGLEPEQSVAAPRAATNPGRFSMDMITPRRRSLTALLVSCIVTSGVLQAQQAAPESEWGRPLGPTYVGPEVRTRPVAPAATLEGDETHTIQIFERAAPSVVFIVNSALQRRLFSHNVYEVPQGAGSGFVWNEAGYIVTNFHVVYNADALTVVLADQ